MNYKLMSLMGALIVGFGFAMAQDYEDDIYYDGNKDTKTVKVVTKQVSPSTGYNSGLYTQVTPLSGVVNGRDVDEYNRRFGYYDVNDTVYLNDSTYLNDSVYYGSDFANTRRIERFHNPDIVIRSNDPDLIEYYFDSAPTVNLIVGSDWSWGPYWGWGYRYYDPWYSWSWGWRSPYYYSSWYDWGWGWYGGYRYHPWAYWGRPWGAGYWGTGYWGRPYRWADGWYGHNGHHYNSGYTGRRPGMNYHGNGTRGRTTYAGAPRNGVNNGRTGINHGNINSTRGTGYAGGTGTMRPGNRSFNNGGGRSAGVYNGTTTGRTYTPSTGGRTYTPSTGGRTYTPSGSNGRSYTPPTGGSTRSGGYSGGSRSGGYSGGSHSGGYSGGSRSSGGFSGGSHGGGSHGGGGGGSHGGRR